MITEIMSLGFIALSIHVIKKSCQFKYDDVMVEDTRRRELLRFADMLAERKSTTLTRYLDEGNTAWKVESRGWTTGESDLGYFDACWYDEDERMNMKGGVFESMSHTDFEELITLLRGHVRFIDHEADQMINAEDVEDFMRKVKQ